MADWYKKTEAGIQLQVRVQPNASKTEIVGVHNGRVKIRVQQPAVGGGANDALMNFLANQLSCRKSAVQIIRGEQIREKTVELSGVTPQQLQRALPFFDW